MNHVCCIVFGDIRFDSRSSKFLQTLAQSGFRATAVMIPEPSAAPYPQEILVRPARIPRSVHFKVRLALFYLLAFVSAVRSGATIFLASDLYSLPVAWLASVCMRKKLAYDSRELYSAIAALRRRPLTQRFWSSCERIFITRASFIITVNESIANVIRENYGLDNIHVVRNIPRSTPPGDRSLLRRNLGIPPETRIALYQGGLQEGRGIRILLSIAQKFPGVAFVFIGSGPLSDEIRSAALSNALIRLHDAVPLVELPGYTAGADIGFCLTENFGLSYYYSLPNKLFEYIMAGVPVIGSSYPELERIVAGSGVGLVADPGDQAAVCAALQRLLSDSALLERCRTRCREVAGTLNWENESQHLLNAFCQK